MKTEGRIDKKKIRKSKTTRARQKLEINNNQDVKDLP